MSRFERLITWSTMSLLVVLCGAMFAHSSNNAMAWNMEKALRLAPLPRSLSRPRTGA